MSLFIDYNSDIQPLFNKNGVDYFQLPNGTVYCKPLNQSNMVGGTGESARNAVHNPTRFERIQYFNQNAKVLDYGCGSGLLVNFLKIRGVDVDGYDKYSNTYNKEILKNTYDVVTMIEVIEHTTAPFNEIDEIFDCLKERGTLMIETSFVDWMTDSNDPYINPSIGHCTIFSHQGLDQLMASKGFEIGEHINRNVRIFHKPIKQENVNKKITLVTMGQGNPIALKRTLESFKDVVSEIVFGDLLIFEHDRELIKSYQSEYNLKIIPLPFNFIFENGFAHTLNTLAEHTTNDFVLYMNIGEVMDGEFDVLGKLNHCNCYYLDHAVETHHWYRLYNKKQLKWGGIIHEEVVGNRTPYPTPIFRFGDTEKDVSDEFYAKVMNDVKEICYFSQYLKLVDQPELIANTHQGWVQYSKDSYDSLKERLLAKGKRYEAFVKGDFKMYLDDIFNNPEFEKERFNSTTLINFQGARKDIL